MHFQYSTVILNNYIIIDNNITNYSNNKQETILLA